MARIRYIKPGFFHNDDLAAMPALTRLCFAGLWTLADRAGRLEDRPKRIKGELFPYEDADVDSMLDCLAHAGFVRRFSVGALRIVQVLNWDKHQRPHKDEPVSKLPMPDESTQSPDDSTHEPEESSGSSVRGLGLGRELGIGTGTVARAPLALAGTFPRDHVKHGWCSSRGKCVPDFLHEEFIRSIGGERKAADQRLRVFYEAREHGWPDGPIGDDPVKLWRREFAASFPSVAPANGQRTHTPVGKRDQVPTHEPL